MLKVNMISVKMLSSWLSKCSLRPSVMKFSTMQQQRVVPGKLSAVCENVFKKTQTSSNLLQEIKAAPCYNLDTVRTIVRYHYYPRALKRMNKFGLEKRLSCRTQREILFRKYIKGRQTLSTFDRFPNQLPGQPYRNSRRIQLFDKKIGYKKPRKGEYYRF